MLLKICGMTSQADLDCANSHGFDLCGFIFHPKSPRVIEPELVARLETGRMKRVGVFVRQGAAEILRIMQEARLDYAQLHGEQTVQDARKIGPERVIRVLWPQKYPSMDQLRAAASAHVCAFYLLDAGASGGGSGASLDWQALANLDLPAPWFLAGGLSPENAARALECCRPHGLDFNSGLELAPGRKCHNKISAARRAVAGMEAR